MNSFLDIDFESYDENPKNEYNNKFAYLFHYIDNK